MAPVGVMRLIRTVATPLGLTGRAVIGLAVLMALLPLSMETDAVRAAADVRLGDVTCSGAPEVVEVRNFGDEGQDLTGWQLQSDGDAPFDLTPSGTIPANGSIFIESGPAARGTFQWSQSEVLRDNDPSDYARLVDSAGSIRGQVACAEGGVAATPTPTPVVAAATATPAADGIPQGGGPPVPTEGVLSPALMIYVGGSLVGAVLGLGSAWLGISLTADRIRRRSRPEASAPAPEPPAADPRISVRPAEGVVRDEQQAARPLLLAIIVALLGAILVAMLVQSQDRRHN